MNNEGINANASPPEPQINSYNPLTRTWGRQTGTSVPEVIAHGLGSQAGSEEQIARARDSLNAGGKALNTLNEGGGMGATVSPSFEAGLSSYQVSSPTTIPTLEVDDFMRPR